MTPDIAALKKLAEDARRACGCGDDWFNSYHSFAFRRATSPAAILSIISALDAAEAETTHLDGQIQTLLKETEAAEARAQTAEQERDEARAALKPFVTFHSGHVLPVALHGPMELARATLEQKG